jgi:hypothetical protein
LSSSSDEASLRLEVHWEGTTSWEEDNYELSPFTFNYNQGSVVYIGKNFNGVINSIQIFSYPELANPIIEKEHTNGWLFICFF